MLAIAVFIGGLSIYEVDNYIQGQAKDFVSVTCINESSQINDSLENMEKSVKIMESYLMDFFTSAEDVKDRTLQEKVIQNADRMFIDIVTHTSTAGAISYYFRMDPSISDGKTGLFYSKINGSNKFISLEPTDLLAYEKDDTERVGWFWQPYEAGKPIWMKPYYNQNNQTAMISYVIPMYLEETFIGVVGMDFDYKVLIERVHEIEIYDNGFAHLEIDGEITCYDEHEMNTKVDIDPEKYLSVSNELENGMTLVVSASYDDIRQIRYDIGVKILFTVLILSLVFTAMVIFIVRRIVGPLKKLTDAAVKLSNGDYDVEIIQSNTQEIKLLSAAFENMTMRLHEREVSLHRSAYRDSQTGLRNTASYKVWAAEFDKKIENGPIDFGVVVLDVNNLKKANDEHGHDVGNELIVASARLICDIFKKSPVFRIGGDEFLVILQNSDLENRTKLFEQFASRCSNLFIGKEEKIQLRIALGFAEFDPSADGCFEDVFKRADDAMYENKRKTKNETL
jgi:diguanylate cyclase (GGDEF)-like protein